MCDSPAGALGVLVPIPTFLEPYVYFTPDHPEFGIDDQGRRCLAVDTCMVPALLALWEKEIPTISACCLHGAGEGVISLPRVLDPGEAQPKPNWLQRDEALARAERAQRLADARGVALAQMQAGLAEIAIMGGLAVGTSFNEQKVKSYAARMGDLAQSLLTDGADQRGSELLAAADALVGAAKQVDLAGYYSRDHNKLPASLVQPLEQLANAQIAYRRLRGATTSATEAGGKG